MTQEQLNKVLELNERKKRLEELNFVVSRPVRITMTAIECTINGSLDPYNTHNMSVSIRYEPELLELIKNYPFLKI